MRHALSSQNDIGPEIRLEKPLQGLQEHAWKMALEARWNPYRMITRVILAAVPVRLPLCCGPLALPIGLLGRITRPTLSSWCHESTLWNALYD